jgi:hypothetical protein
MFEGANRGRYKTVGDVEHSEIIRLYVEEGLGMDKIGKKQGRSSRTVKDAIDAHDAGLDRGGVCPICERAKGSYSKTKARRTSVSEET